MKKKRTSRKAAAASLPFALGSRAFQAAWQAGQMMLASAEVIGYRSLMMGQALAGGDAGDPEFTRMWSEKMTANAEFMQRLFKTSSAAPLHFGAAQDLEQYMRLVNRQLKEAQSCMHPYRKASRANAKRLRKTFLK